MGWIEKKTATIKGKTMAWAEMGTGDPIVFLHGNPTSSYLWRNVMPHLESMGRCIAPDLIGMGDSDKLDNPGPDSYRFVEHREYLDGLLAHLDLTENVTLVIHDWGSALGFDWANRHREAMFGIAYMEAIVRPIIWNDWPEQSRPIFGGLRSPAGDELVLGRNAFVELILPGSIKRDLADHEMAEYRRPFENAGEDRRPTLTWPRQIPLGDEPVDVCETVDAYGAYMRDAEMPKLFIAGAPGMIMNGSPGDFARSWKNTREATVKGLHFLQEDSPDEIAAAVKNWLAAI